MPRIRPETLDALHGALSAATVAWTPEVTESSLTNYVVKQGVFHLLDQGRKDDAEARMLDLHFMAGFADAWPTVVEPLRAWRVVGLRRAKAGYVALIESCLTSDVNNALLDAAQDVSGFLCRSGLYEPGVRVAEWEYEIRALNGGINSIEGHGCLLLLASLYKEQGRYVEAETLLLKVLEAREGDLGLEHLKTIETVNDLAAVYRVQGRLNESRSLYSRALSTLNQTKHSEELFTLQITIMHNLALVQDDQGCHAEAKDLLERALAIAQRDLSPSHLDVIHLSMSLAGIYATGRRYTEAEQMFLTVIPIQEAVLGQDHPFTLISLGNLAVVYTGQGRYSAAKALHQRTLAAREQNLGSEHPHTLDTLSSLGTCYAREGCYDEAAAYYQRAFDTRARTLGTDHPDTSDSSYRLGWLYARQGRFSEAEPLLMHSLIGHEHCFGASHSKTTPIRYLYALVLQKLNRHDLALTHFTTTLACEIDAHGKDDPELAMTHWNIAKCLRKLDRPADAATHRRRCWEIECKDDGPAAAGTLQTAHALVEDLIAADQTKQAMTVVESALTAAAQATDEDEDRAKWVEKLDQLRHHLG